MKVKELLTDESKWTKGAFARDSNECKVYSRDVDAVRWCLMGAISKCYSDFNGAAIRIKVLDKLNGNIDEFNDAPSTTFEDVRKLVNELDI